MSTRALALFLAALSPLAAAQSPSNRVIILGFDGVDPALAQQMIAAGELPNLKALQEQGGFQPLESSNPPQSPSAWSSFATCRTPLNHGIYDFLKRTPAKYLPGVGFGSATRPKLNPDGSVATPPGYTNNRKGQSFWKTASDQGKKAKALLVPFAYPADELGDECKMLCGLTVPTIRGTENWYFAFAEEFEKESTVAGGYRMPLRFEGNAAAVHVAAMADPRKQGAFITAPMTVTVDRPAKALTIAIGDQTVPLKEGDWSPWVTWRFEVSPVYTVSAISRFCAMSAGDSVRLYMSCLQFDPRDPYMPISSPRELSKALYDRYGLYKTIGWDYDTHALKTGDMTEEMFLQDVKDTVDFRAQMTYDEIDAGNFDLLLAAWTAPDRVSHMFWAYRDPKHPLYTPELAAKYGRAVENEYIRMDGIVGEVTKRLQPNDLLMVMSDHGFHSQRKNFSVNTWLVRNGYLAVRGQSDPATAFNDKQYLIDLATGEPHYDWSKSRAYGIGLGMVFLNLQGREGQGIVSPAEAPALLAEIKTKLMAEKDPETGDPVFRNVYVYYPAAGEAAVDAPDIQLGYAEGYQTDKDSAAGAAPKDVYSPNDSKWSGEHASSDAAFTQGILFANKTMAQGAAIIDLGVTALAHLGLPKPADAEGKSLLP